ncbi:MAG: restriction endonuclease subunit S [Bacteroidia bacterium]|nr:restriction endonuclease subunit S [Bacteroidia bacterium]
MSEIQFKPFGSLLKKIIDNRGKTCPTSDTGLPLIATNCISNKQLYPVHSKVRFVDEHTYIHWFRGHPEPDDMIFVTKGTPGRVCWVPNPVDFCIAQDMLSIRPDKGKVYPKYLFAALRSKTIQQEIEGLHVGSLIPHFKKGDFNELQIPIPSKEIQEYIGDQYFNLCLKIDLLHRQNATLEKMAETLFRQWFVEEAKEEWDYQLTLGDLIESVSITHKFPNPSVVFLNTSDIYLGNVIEHNHTSVKGLPGQAKKTIRKDDILFSEIRPANGRWAYIDFEAENYVVSTKLMVLRSKNVLSQAFIYFYLTNPATVEWLQMIAESRSGTFPQITFDQIRDLKINVPSEKILQDSIIWCESTLKKIKFNQTQIRTLTTLRDTLLPKLMSGEVRVIP